MDDDQILSTTFGFIPLANDMSSHKIRIPNTYLHQKELGVLWDVKEPFLSLFAQKCGCVVRLILLEKVGRWNSEGNEQVRECRTCAPPLIFALPCLKLAAVCPWLSTSHHKPESHGRNIT